MKKAIIFIILSLFVAILSSPKSAKASEGEFELKNQVGENARCWAASVLMQDLKYKILVSCRDIIYPGGTEVFSYLVWANPIDGGNPQKLGTLGYGKVEFTTNKAFTSLFVTKEQNPNTRSPNGVVVMQGGLQKIGFLENPNLQKINEPELGQPEPTPSPIPSKKSSLNLFRLGGPIAFIALFLIILLVMVITRR